MKMRVVDFETTDKPRPGRTIEIVEFGFTDVFGEHTLGPVSGLVNPGIPISPEARGVHHISDAMVAGGCRPAEARAILMSGMEAGDLFVAHHAAFERALFPGYPFDWICTLTCAKHLFPDAPGFGNQTLRYCLDLDAEIASPERTMPAHRAGPDTYVTAHLLRRLLRQVGGLEAAPKNLVELTNTPVLLREVPFQSHEGKLWSDMDTGFLEWVVAPGKKKPMDDDVLHTARHWLNLRRKPQPSVF